MDTSIPGSPPQIIDGITLKFPAVIWRIVNSCSTGALTWEADGISIRVDKAKFEDEYLRTQTFFKTKNFQSFIRQLNIYGFRKIPAHYPKGQEDAIFVYRHNFFRRGHPELLTEVVRNTAIRRTQKENHYREVDTRHGRYTEDGSLETSPLVVKVPSRRKVDESHPLLKCPAEPVVRYGVAVEPLMKEQYTMSTVCSRVALTDMQRISPTKLHHQVTGLLTSINNSDDEDGPVLKRMRPYRTVQRPKELQTKSRNKLDFTSKADNLSQESNCSKFNDQLMFGCLLDKDDDDDLSIQFDQSHHEDICNILAESDSETQCFSLDDSLTGSMISTDDIDVFNSETLATSDELYEKDPAILTPAYFDPGTGTVTLLLPSLSPES